MTGLLERFEMLIEEDGRAYARMSKVRAQGAEEDAIVEAVEEAAMVPLRMIRASIEGLELILESIQECRVYLVADLQVSIELLLAVAKGAEAIAEANVLLLESPASRAEFRNTLSQAVEDAKDLCARIKMSVESREGVVDPDP